MKMQFEGLVRSNAPFPHLRISKIMHDDDANGILAWLKGDAPWKLTIADFYEQYEFSLLSATLTPELGWLVSDQTVQLIAVELQRNFCEAHELRLVEVSVHRLTRGQTIKIHNDYLEAEESHRLLIQLNEGWEASQGGLLMLFESEKPESVTHVLLPTHGSGFAFEISSSSFHAVSSINSGERYTLVYTFCKK